MTDWKEAARHFWFGRRLSERHEIVLKQRLWREQEKRVTLVNTLSDILTDIAYDDDDLNQEYCNVCHRSLIEEDGHQIGCLYVLGLAIIAEAGRSAD